jgi:hypothetical protein
VLFDSSGAAKYPKQNRGRFNYQGRLAENGAADGAAWFSTLQPDYFNR